MPVSRHGLQENGVRCPSCGELAVEPGDWTKVHLREYRDGTADEAVCCWHCNSFLMASPDSDIDPISEDQDGYDHNIYHRFVRPEGWQPPKQRVCCKKPEKGDWVVADPGAVAWMIPDGWQEGDGLQDIATAPMGGSEGMVSDPVTMDGCGEMVKVDLMNLGPMTRTCVMNLSNLSVMLFESFREGTKVKCIRGEHRGRIGHISELHHQQSFVTVTFDGTPAETRKVPYDWVTVIP